MDVVLNAVYQDNYAIAVGFVVNLMELAHVVKLVVYQVDYVDVAQHVMLREVAVNAAQHVERLEEHALVVRIAANQDVMGQHAVQLLVDKLAKDAVVLGGL